MHVSVTGISHHETPVELRELFAFGPDDLAPALRRIASRQGGAAILSTCNRTELYLTSERGQPADHAFAQLVQAHGGPEPEGVRFFHLDGPEAVRHLFKVAAGVDSLVIGESEILGQVRGAFSASTEAGSGDAVLARLFHSALRVGRRVRSETEIGAHGLSVAALGVSLSRQIVGDLRRKAVLVVGAGEAGQRSAGALVQQGVGRLMVTTRRSGLAQELAQELNGVALPWEQLPQAIGEADVIITCTAAPGAIIHRDEVAAAMAGRPQRPLLIVDIAVPRDVESSVRELPGVHLYDIDDLQAASQRNLEARQREVVAAEAIVEQEALRFDAWLGSRRVTPTIAALRERAEALRRSEVERTLARLGHLEEADRARIEAMTRALVNKLMHAPMTRLREAGSERHLDALHELFALDED